MWSQGALQRTSLLHKVSCYEGRHSREAPKLVPALPKQKEPWAIAALYKLFCT